MPEIFSNEMIGKNAMTNGGYFTGVVEDVVFDTETGYIKYLLIKGTSGSRSTDKVDSKGRMVLAVTSIQVTGSSVIYT